MEEVALGVVVGVGVVVLVKKPASWFAKTLVMAGQWVSESTREFVCKSGETWSDLVAEARQELKG